MRTTRLPNQERNGGLEPGGLNVERARSSLRGDVGPGSRWAVYGKRTWGEENQHVRQDLARSVPRTIP